MRVRGLLTAGTLFAIAAACVSPALAFDFLLDMGAPYSQRIEGVTPGAGNAKAVNSVIHTIDPWPRTAGNRRIPGNGERMAGAIERYRDVRKLPLTPQPLAPTSIGVTGPGSGAATMTPPVAAPVTPP